MNEIHCLKCDHVWDEEESPDICPYCGNADKQQTVYQTNQKENTMNTAEQFALDQWLSDYPDDMSYPDILTSLSEPDHVWTMDNISVCSAFETLPLSQVAEFIEDTKTHFEIATRGMK
jgi:hypothetical protein